MSSPVKGGGGGGSTEEVVADPTRLGELNAEMLGRVLKLLARSAALGEDLDPFKGETATAKVAKSVPSSPKKKKTKAKPKANGRGSRSRSRSTAEEDEDAEKTESDAEADEGGANVRATEASGGEVGDEDLERLSKALEIACESVAAAACAISLLAADSLPKQVSQDDTFCPNPERKD